MRAIVIIQCPRESRLTPPRPHKFLFAKDAWAFSRLPFPGYLFLPPLLFPDFNPIIRTRLRFQEGRKNLKTQMGSHSVFLTQGLGLMRLKDGERQRVCVQFSSVTLSCPTLCDPMDYSMPGLPVHYQLPEATQTHVHWVGDTTQPSHPL